MNTLNNILNFAMVAALAVLVGIYFKENFAFDFFTKENIPYTVVGFLLAVVAAFTVKECRCGSQS
jgi:uncharacterized integral membrane protein